jgi:glycerophosphoryl diester phosphodiesterase
VPLDAPENSLTGIARAGELGADVVEVDARVTRDGVAVLNNDLTTWRVDRRPWLVRCTTARRLGRPTLASALTAAVEARIRVAIDVKDPNAAAAVVDAVRSTGTEDRVHLWTRERRNVEFFRAEFPGNEVALLRETHDRAAHVRLLDEARAWGASAASANQDGVDPWFVDAARERQIDVYVWYQTLDKLRSRLPSVAAAGLRGVVSDWPVEARALLDAAERK